MKTAGGLTPISDQIGSFMDSLRCACLLAWIPRQRYLGSFAETPEELEISSSMCGRGGEEPTAQSPSIFRPAEILSFGLHPGKKKARRDEENGVAWVDSSRAALH
jgi:hypothetical protein